MTKRLSRREFVGAATAASLPLITGLPSIAGAERVATAVAAKSETAHAPDAMDHDLLEVTIPALHAFYESKKYTVTQVTHWYLARIARYNPVYRALIHVDTAGALKTAAAQDAAAKAGGKSFKMTDMWGVPVVIKANTSVKGLVTSAGYYGYMVPGLELIAPQDAPVVAKLRAAGVVILGQTNMPDFAASDTNYSTAFGRTGNAYNPRFSPGGSSGGTVTAVTANLCLMGTGTDTANSIRMPAATSSVVGVLPTRGLVSIAGIQPLDWLRDNTGPIARNVRDTAIALTVMAGEDPKDFRTKGSAAQAEPGPYTKYLNAGALAGKRFGVPAFMMAPAAPGGGGGGTPLQPETRDMFMKAIEGLKAAGATVVFDDGILDSSFTALTRAMSTRAYTGEGTENFLRDFGPPEYHSSAEYAQVMGVPLSGTATGAGGGAGGRGAAPAAGRGGAAPAPAPAAPAAPRLVETDPEAETTLWAPQRAAVAAYDATLDKYKLDGLIYPAIQMPPNDELSGLPDQRSSGPHSNTGWVNNIGVPAISMPAGFYENGLPFGLEFSTKRWHDGDLLGWVYSYEQATKLRKPPVLIENTKRRPTG